MTDSSQVTMDGEDAYPDETVMNIVYVTDRGGNSLKFQMFGGKYYAPFYKPSTLAKIQTFDLRSDDVFLSTYPRTGSNWMFEIISMLLKGKAETVCRSKTSHQIEYMISEKFALVPSPRILCAHMRLSDAPQQLMEKKCRIVYTIRDPRDVAVSLYHLYRDLPFSEYQGEFRDFLYLFLEEKVDCSGMFAHLRDAEKFFEEHPDIPVHIQVYEEAVEDLRNVVQQISNFLGLQTKNELCEEIADKCRFSRLKADKDAYSFKTNGRNILFRKGIVGDWQNWFTDQMLEDYYRVYDEKMAGSRFYERYARKQNRI